MYIFGISLILYMLLKLLAGQGYRLFKGKIFGLLCILSKTQWAGVSCLYACTACRKNSSFPNYSQMIL